MSVELTTKFAPQTDELFKAESKTFLLTNTDYDWTGAHAIKLYKISTTPMNDYARNRSAAPEDSSESLSRYGQLLDLSATTEELLLKHDRKVMTDGAGTKPVAAALTKSNIYAAVLTASQALDDAEVPETDRVLIVTPATYALLKQAVEFDHTEIGADMRARGVVAMLDGASVVKVPAVRLPAKFGFMLAHPSATVAPVKLEDFGIHNDTPLSSGTIVTGRVCYDAFVLDNKKTGIYYQATT